MSTASLKFIAMASLLGLLLPVTAQAQSTQNLTFETHAAFFSKETKQPNVIDPQVFVADPLAEAGTGPQNIVHVAKFRPATVASDPATPVYDAKGNPLGFSLGSWLGAKGKASIKPVYGGAAEIIVEFTGLQPRGVYSLFENHFDQNPVGFTPLDGQGSANSFTADAKGSATIRIKAPQVPTNVNAILLVFHSDGQSHGETRGEIGVNAHHQIIAKIP
jgi:hypothetical protein